jgi:hypothetical protein
MSALCLGSDAVTLVVRVPVVDADQRQIYDSDGRPVFADRRVPKTGAKFTIDSVSEAADGVVSYAARCALPVDDDTLALTTKDAVEFDGKLYECSGDARPKRTLIEGELHHVRAMCSREERARGVAERVTIIARGGQDDDGIRLSDGPPVEAEALSVDAGNTAAKYGADGTISAADFTVVLAPGSGVRDDDWIVVRGRHCTARVARVFSQHHQANVDVVLARSATGGG